MSTAPSVVRADKMVKVEPFRVTVAGKDSFGCVNMAEFLAALRAKLKPNPTASRTLLQAVAVPAARLAHAAHAAGISKGSRIQSM